VILLRKIHLPLCYMSPWQRL